MPLCPSCIRQHTQYHQQLQTKPSYFNIYQALSQTDTLITTAICNLQKDKKRNSQLILTINKLTTNIKQKILQAKAMTYKIVQQCFIQLEKDTLEQMAKINQELNMFSLRKAETYEKEIVVNLQQLYDLVQGLKTQTCLADMIYFLKQKRFQVDDMHQQLSEYLYSNQNYTPFIQINKQAQQGLSLVISRMMRLDPKQKNGLMAILMGGKNMGMNMGMNKGSNILKQHIIGNNNNSHKYDNFYHISLTPSKNKHIIPSLQKVNNNNKYSRAKNSPYRNFNQYQQQISRNSPSREQPSFRQINTSDRQRKNVSGYQYNNDKTVMMKFSKVNNNREKY